MAMKKKNMLLVSKCVAHCGCGWNTSSADANETLGQAIEHYQETGHGVNFQGEIRRPNATTPN